jgi:prepilin-type N-terminal cleavage/methylation domain-containing protein
LVLFSKKEQLPLLRACAHQYGFTLLEVLVATVIATIALVMLFRFAVDGATAVRGAGAAEAAISEARSRLAVVGEDIAAWPVDSRGKDGLFDWRLHIVRDQVASPGAGVVAALTHAGEQRAALFIVELEVAWSIGGRRHTLQVRSSRLGFVVPPSEVR